ncbi:hypothetical protein [Actinopolymorpha alba]|uniref:hypothetical protein n=1 Tax=Actinopolymorpha alba TaxID=533267 RepID=UPI00037C869B|nr:hypothetical protein [Actinopolymorpha alba]
MQLDVDERVPAWGGQDREHHERAPRLRRLEPATNPTRQHVQFPLPPANHYAERPSIGAD